MNWLIRNPEPSDFHEMMSLSKRVYPFTTPWTVEQMECHYLIFSEGQFIAVHPESGAIVGIAFALRIDWHDYDMRASWRDYTDQGWFTNHDPNGTTLYGAEIMADPECRGQGVGKALYRKRHEFAQKLGLRRIRAGARLRGYHKYSQQLTPEQYLQKVALGEIFDPTISFQMKHGYRVLDVVPGYLVPDPESLGYAAVIEWLNPALATAKDYELQEFYFQKNIVSRAALGKSA